MSGRLSQTNARNKGGFPMTESGSAEQSRLRASKILTAAGLRSSEIRIRVLLTLEKANTALTPNATYLEMQNECSHGAVYRALAELNKAGLVVRCRTGSGHIAYALLDGRPNLLAVCSRCGATHIVEDPGPVEHMARALTQSGFTMNAVPIYVSVLCSRCLQPTVSKRKLPIRSGTKHDVDDSRMQHGRTG